MQKRNKLLLGGLSTAAVVTGVALTGGTSAYYYDLESSNENLLGACSLDLQETSVDVLQTEFAHDDGVGIQSAPGDTQASVDVNINDAPSPPGSVGGLSRISMTNLQPGDAFQVTINLKNTGDCAGELWADVRGPFDDSEGAENTEAETSWQEAAPENDPDVAPATVNDVERQQATLAGYTGETDGYDNGQGDLDNRIEVSYDGDSVNGPFDGSFTELAWLPPWMINDDFVGGTTHSVVLDLAVPDSGEAGDGNEIMGDSFEFLIDFAAAQKNKINPRPGGTGLNLNALP